MIAGCTKFQNMFLMTVTNRISAIFVWCSYNDVMFLVWRFTNLNTFLNFLFAKTICTTKYEVKLEKDVKMSTWENLL